MHILKKKDLYSNLFAHLTDTAFTPAVQTIEATHSSSYSQNENEESESDGMYIKTIIIQV